MAITNGRIRRMYRILLLLLTEMGLILQFTAAARAGRLGIAACFYTNQSNILVFLYYLALTVFFPDRENGNIKGMLVLGIGITGLGYHFLLHGSFCAGIRFITQANIWDVLANGTVHYIVPAAVFLDYLLFTEKGKMTLSLPFLGLVLPLCYAGFALIRAEVSRTRFYGGSLYPYEFLNPVLLGWGGFFRNMLFLLPLLLALGFLLLGIDRLLGRITDRRTL